MTFHKKKVRVSHILETTRQSVACGDLCSIRLADGKSIEATKNHAFWVKEKAWCAVSPEDQSAIKVRTLQKGDYLVDFRGSPCEVCAIDSYPKQDLNTVEVFNLLIEGHGSFFVSGFLSHSGMVAETNKEN